jgi:low temperature requirement protein LtrA
VVLEAYNDVTGGLPGPIVFVVAYILARGIHAVVFVFLSEPALRRRTVITVVLSFVPTGTLLTAGALLSAPWQIWCTLAAVAIEPIVAYRTSIGVDWPVRSTAHFTERHGLIIILALGESILGIGAGAATEPISTSILVGVVISMLICVQLWWAYFTRLARAAEHALAALPSNKRARPATDAYTYLHLMLVGGIVIAALGLEVAMAHIEGPEPFGLFGAAALAGGVACYLAGTSFFAHRLIGRWNVTRLVCAAVLVLAVPVLALVSPVVALASVATILPVLFFVERKWQDT